MMEPHSDEVIIRPAMKEDMKAVAEMIQELADFEKMSDGPLLSVSDLERDGFEIVPRAFECLVAECAGAVVGYSVFFPTYSTWCGKALALEDLYVRTDHRRRGIGNQLFNAVAKETHSRGCCRLDFHVLEWNPARSFYERKGAENLTRSEQWCFYRLSGAALAQAAGDK